MTINQISKPEIQFTSVYAMLVLIGIRAVKTDFLSNGEANRWIGVTLTPCSLIETK